MAIVLSSRPTAAAAAQLPGSVRVTGLKLNRKGSLLLANCHDRVVRMFEVAPRASFGSGAGGESAVPLEQGAAMARLMERGSLENKVGDVGK